MPKTVTALIVDDERFSRDELSYLLKQNPSMKIVGEAENGEEAIMKTIQLQPDVLFLDVEMPKMGGMEVAKSVQELKKQPLIIFATAYPDFAVEAFRREAIDYLLKPFEEDQVNDAIRRLERLLLSETREEKANAPTKLAVEGEDEIIYLNPSQILYAFRDDRITKIVAQEGTYETKLPLKEVEQRLEGYSFFRTHKSYLVHLHDIERLVPWFNGAYQLELKGRKEMLPVSRNYVKALRKRLEL